ncbi:MAG: extracellular solute-binding protein, partial [Bacteroidota bacterium]|nr:extracellular solute-binding protein [Bacteroidota bacterium]
IEEENMEQWWEPGIYQGNVYGLPYVHVGVTLAFNKDIFDAAGVAYPPNVNDPNLSEWTWDKFVEVAEELTDPDKDQWGYAWAANWAGDAEVWEYCYVKQGGNDIVNEDGTAVGFDNPDGLKSFEYMNDFVTNNIVPDGGMNPKFQDYFLTGKAAMAPFDVYQVIGIINNNPELNIGITPYPQGPGTDLLDGRGMHANVGFLYLSEVSENPEMAFELMKFLTEKENVEDYINAVGLFGARNDYEMKIENPEAQEIAREILEAANRYGFAYPIDPKQIEVRTIFVAEVQNMIEGTKSPEEAWQDAVSKMNEALKE